jgi:CheY-like chemotaxis protein
MSNQLAGKRILIVEDEYFVAADLRRLLEHEGAIVVGPVGGLEAGLALAESEQLDAAVLDVNLEGVVSYAIVDRLRERAVPYAFLTGYDGWAIPPLYRDAPRVTKPFLNYSMLAVVEQLFAEVDVT